MSVKSALSCIYPKVVQAGLPASFVIELGNLPGLAHDGMDILADGAPCRLLLTGLQWPARQPDSEQICPYELDWQNRRIGTTIVLPAEQEYRLSLVSGTGDQKTVHGSVSLYALEQDLSVLRPWKGDMHMHSNRSDGRDTPGHVAAACRRIGLDFMALTDHGQYAPSMEAREAFASAAIDLCIYPGEEVHAPDNPIHIINFGGATSVNSLFSQPEYKAGVAQIDAETGPLPEGVDRYEYASSVWVFKAIRACGGLGIFCHPYWICMDAGRHQGYYISEHLTSHLFDTQPFDALELLGGYHLHESEANILQVARYQEERAKGRHIPVVGVSDAHGCETGELFGWFYTIVFARSPAYEDLAAAIRNGLSVAVEALPGEVVRAYGPFRLVKYALFLLREVFPEHDALCRTESELMKAWLGEQPAQAAAPGAVSREEAGLLLAAKQGQTRRLMERQFAANGLNGSQTHGHGW